MDKYQTRTDVSFWNLDALEFAEKPNAEGSIERKTVTEDIGDVAMAALKLQAEGGNYILWLRSTGALQKLDLQKMEITALHVREDTQDKFIDLTMDQSLLYTLVKAGDKYYIRKYKVITNALLPRKTDPDPNEWLIDSDQVTRESRLKVATAPDHTTKAYVSIPGKSQFLFIDLATEQTSILNVGMPVNAGTLGREIDFCIDARKETLVVADTLHHRIVEIDCKTGTAQVICGNGRPGNAPEETTARGAQLNSPTSVAIYRPNEMIQVERDLSLMSLTLLRTDPARIKPRTILVADAGNFRIKKIVDLPFVAGQQSHLSDEPFIYTLIGSGSDQRGPSPKVKSKHKQDLRTYPMPRPSTLLTTRSGELIIYFQSQKGFLFLKPSTSMPPKMMN
jgi:hypothetical protein